MKVKDTLEIDLIYSTLTDKLMNFIHEEHRYVGSFEATDFIKKTYSCWHYTGMTSFQEIMKWCEQHFGNNWIWNYETIYFKHEKDRTLFALRWS